MPYAIKIENETGSHFWPRGYGFTAHAFTQDKADAEPFQTEDAARRTINAYRWPSASAFWNSEREHAKRHEEKTRGWKFSVVPV